MQKLVVLWICAASLSAAAASAGGAGQESPAEAKISDLGWLAGYWMSDERGQLADECWLPLEGAVILGIHRDVHDDGDVFFEYIRIMETPEGIFYYAAPGGYNTTKFKLTELSVDGTSARAVFENPEHDSPRLIRYVLSGSELMAQIEGFEDEQKIITVWNWQRAEFPQTRKSAH